MKHFMRIAVGVQSLCLGFQEDVPELFIQRHHVAKKYLINVTESTSSGIKVNITCLSVSPSLSRQHSFSIINPLLSLMPLPPVLLLFAFPPIAN